MMAYITSDLVIRIQQRIRDTAYNSAEIISYINDVMNDVYNEYRLPFMQASVSFTTAAGVADISNGVGLPTDYVQAIDIAITTVGIQRSLIYMDYTAIDEMYPSPTSTVYGRNLPRFWYYFANTINTFQVSDRAYTATMRYYKRPTMLLDSSSSDIPSLPSEFAELIIVGAAYRIMQVKDNFDQAAIYQNKYDEILAKLVNKYSLRQTGQATMMRGNRFAVAKRRF